MIDLSNFCVIPNNPYRAQLSDPTIALLTLRVSGKHTYTNLSACIRRKLGEGRFKILVDADYETVLLMPADASDVTAYRFSAKSGGAYCSSFIRLFQENGNALPARFIGEWDDESNVFILHRQSDAPAKKPKAVKKPRTQGLESLLPKE